MPRKIDVKMAPSPCTHLNVRTGVLLCAVSLLPLAAYLSPVSVSPVSVAHAQQLPNPATQELFLAVDRNDLAAVRDAVNKGADIEARDFTGTQPVDMAIDRGYFEIAKYLISVRNSRTDLAAQQPATLQEAVDPAFSLPETTAPELAEAPQTPPLQSPAEIAEGELDADDGEADAAIAAPETTEAVKPSVEAEATDQTESADPFDLSGPAELQQTPAPPPPVDELGELLAAEPESTPEARAHPETADDVAAEETAEVPEQIEAASPLPDAPSSTPEMGVSEMAGMADASVDNIVDEPLVAAEQIAETPPQPENEDIPAFEFLIDEQPSTDQPADAQDRPAPDINPAITQAPSSRTAEPEDVPPADTQEQAAAPKAEDEAIEKPSAAKRFFTTFLDFFKPPNVTGVVRREGERDGRVDALSEEELARQLEQLEAERGDAVIKGPEVPISPEELARELPQSPDLPEQDGDAVAALPDSGSELPPYMVQPVAPRPDDADVFGDLTIDDNADEPIADTPPQTVAATPAADTPRTMWQGGKIPDKPNFKEAPGVPGKRYDPSKPFGGGVDPDILAYLDLDARTGLSKSEMSGRVDGIQVEEPEETLASTDNNPFELLEGAEEPGVADLLEGLDEPQDVAALDPKSPPSRAEDDPFADPFATSNAGAADNPFAAPAGAGEEVDELAGLLETTNENVDGTQGWDVSKVEGGTIPSEVVLITDIEPTGDILDGVELSLGTDTKIGKEVGEDRMALIDEDTPHKPCLSKTDKSVVFCVDKISWPFELEEDFLVDTIMYQGTRAIARYDAGRASKFHTLFRSASFEKVISYYINRYGQPSETVKRAIAPLAAPRQDNPTYLWQSREPGTDTIVTLEIRKFDDAQGGGFPDTKRGVILLYRSHAKDIFPMLSQLELMVLKDEGSDSSLGGSGTDSGGAPASIW